MGETFRDKISRIRSKGRGCATIGTSQVYFDVSDAYRKTCTVQLLGKLNDADIKTFASAGIVSKDRKMDLVNMTRGDFYKFGYEQCTFTISPPSHGHKEEDANFFDLYKKHYGNKMRVYKPLVDEIENMKKLQDMRVRDMVNGEYDRERECVARKLQEKEARRNASIKNTKAYDDNNVSDDASTERLRHKLQEAMMYLQEYDAGMTYMQIGANYGCSHTRIRSLCLLAKEYNRKKAEQDLSFSKAEDAS